MAGLVLRSIRFKRTNKKESIPTEALFGEPIYCKETNSLYIGQGLGQPLKKVADGSDDIKKYMEDNFHTKEAIDLQIKAIEDNKANKDEVAAQFQTIEQQLDELKAGDIDLTGYQKNTDNSLATTNKTVIGAINEVFQNVSSGKQLIATAITGKGINTSSNDTFQVMADNINAIQGGDITVTDTSLGAKLYSFMAVSDIHHGRTDYNVPDDTIKMLEGINALDIDFVCSTGDLVVDSPNTRIPTFKTLWNSYTNKRLYACTGNHDALVTESIWQQYIGHGFRYSFEKNGDVFLFMSADNDVPITGTPTDFYSESLTWLAGKMTEYVGKRIFLFMHYPLYGYSGLAPGATYGFPSNSTESSTIAGYLRSVGNLIIFSGHSHQPFATETQNTNYNNIKFYGINSSNSATIGMPSISLPRNTDLSYITASNPVEGMLVDVYEKGVVFRGYDFVKKESMDEYTYYLQVANSNSINIITSVESISINESAYADFTVKLSRQIDSNIVVNIASSNDYVTLNKSSLTFTPSNWNTPQIVRVTANHYAENYDILLSNIILTSSATNSKSITTTINNVDEIPYTYYSITNTLTGCRTSNSATQIQEETPYSATITLNNNYQLQSMKVTMGGTDITSSTVNGMNISIASVTGNIVITVIAVEKEVVVTEEVLFSLNDFMDNKYTIKPSLSNATYDSATRTFTFTGKSASVTASASVSIPTINAGETVYAKWDSYEISGGYAIADKIGIAGTSAFHSSAIDYYDYTRELVMNFGVAKSSMPISIKVSSSSTITTFPVTLKINNFRVYRKVYS